MQRLIPHVNLGVLRWLEDSITNSGIHTKLLILPSASLNTGIKLHSSVSLLRSRTLPEVIDGYTNTQYRQYSAFAVRHITNQKMRIRRLSTYTFIVDFRGGTYCSQVQAEDANKSVSAWLAQIEKEQDQIKYLGATVLEDLKKEAKDKSKCIVPLEGLKNTWFTAYPTKQGYFFINIIKTVSE